MRIRRLLLFILPLALLLGACVDPSGPRLPSDDDTDGDDDDQGSTTAYVIDWQGGWLA
jgi:hypothetical protein